MLFIFACNFKIIALRFSLSQILMFPQKYLEPPKILISGIYTNLPQ